MRHTLKASQPPYVIESQAELQVQAITATRTRDCANSVAWKGFGIF